MRRKGFTLIELLVVIAIIAMLLAILMPALSKVKKIAQRVVCGTNLKGLGTAQTVYANDYEDRYAVAQYTLGRTLWDQAGPGRTAEWAEATPNWTTGYLSIGSSLYLLVREADVSPKSFVCPSSAETVFDGKNPYNSDITELWDFGHPGSGSGPGTCQSYAYHFPYSSRAADGSRGAAFAMMADKNPYMDEKLPFAGDTAYATDPQAAIDQSWALRPDWNGETPNQRYENQGANSQPHSKEGQNVVFGDGHSSFEKRADVGVTHDNIYTRWPSATPGANQRRKGLAPIKMATTFVDLTPAGQNDSFLVNDSRRDQSGQ